MRRRTELNEATVSHREPQGAIGSHGRVIGMHRESHRKPLGDIGITI
jgi:hypothetical protein